MLDLLVDQWQCDTEGRARQAAVDQFDTSTALADHAMGHCQPQPTALAHRFGGEKRLEQRGSVRLGNAGTVVLDLQHQLGTIAPPAQAHQSARAGLGGIAQQIGQRLLETRRVDPAVQGLCRCLQLQPHLQRGQLIGHRRGCRMRQHLGGHLAQRRACGAAEIQQVADDGTEPRHLLANLQQRAAMGFAQLVIAQHALRLAVDHTERASQLMRDASR